MIYFDSETFNELPIKHGTYRYVSTCELMIVTYAFDDGPVQLWDRTRDKKMPGDLEYALLEDDDLITAHSSMFDRNVLCYALGIVIPIERWRDTMVKALAHSLPGGLDKLCAIFKIPEAEAKLKTGKQLMNLFCKPRPANMKLRRATRETHPQEWADFCHYAINDTAAMRAIDRKLPSWNWRQAEIELWHLDQRINDRGFAVDTDLAEAAIRAVSTEQRNLAEKTNEATRGKVSSATKRDALLAHILEEYSVDLPNMQMSTLERRIADPDLPIELRELLAIRLQSTTTSTSKYKAVLNGVVDGRLRGTMQFNGAQRTGRWAHRGFQPGNMPRPDMPQDEIAFAIEAIKGACADLVLDDVMRASSNSIRGVIVAPKGRKLCVADLSNIEGRAGAYLAGESWKVKAFRDFDNGIGEDLYKVSYGKSFRVDPHEVTKFQRQIGKVQELMLQYGGGVGAYITGADTYGINLEEMAKTAYPILPGNVLHEAEGFWQWTLKKHRNTFGLPEKTFIVCDSLKRMWRVAQPQIATIWEELEDAVRTAVATPGETVLCRLLRIRCDGSWLRIQLPSSRSLCYPSIHVADSGTISYMGINQYTRKWSRIKTYGGKLFENICQAFARDVMAYAMPSIEEAGYDPLLSIHDEVLAETDDSDSFSYSRVGELLATPPRWAQDIPLAANGFDTYRYRKD